MTLNPLNILNILNEKFKYFLELNKNKLYIPDIKRGIHEIDQSSLNTIKENIIMHTKHDQYIKNLIYIFITRLFKIIRYIDFDTYIEKLYNIGDEIYNKIKLNEYSAIYLTADGENNKSNTWVLLLLLNKLIINNNINKIDLTNVFLYTNTKELYESLKGNSNKILIICCDDMIYSGDQMSTFLPTLDLNNPNIDIYLGVAYISKIGFHNIINKPCVNFQLFENTEVIDSPLVSFVFENTDDQESKKLKEAYDFFCGESAASSIYKKDAMTYNSFGCSREQSFIYFDHKIADAASIIQKFLYYVIYPVKNSDQCKYTQIINNCNNKESFKSTYCSEKLNDIEFQNSCPKTFYKTFQYSINKDINSDKYITFNLISLINSIDDSIPIQSGTTIDPQPTVFATEGPRPKLFATVYPTPKLFATVDPTPKLFATVDPTPIQLATEGPKSYEFDKNTISIGDENTHKVIQKKMDKMTIEKKYFKYKIKYINLKKNIF